MRNLTLSNTTTKATANGDAVPSNGDAVPSNGAVCTPGEEGSKDESATAATAEEAIVEAAAKLKEAIDRRCALVREHGFINYFGLQRFGTGGAPTSEVGLAMLKEDWGGAVRLIMRPRLGENEATHNSKVRLHMCIWTPAPSRLGPWLCGVVIFLPSSQRFVALPC